MTYNQILIKAGIDIKELNFVRRSKEECLETIKEITIKLGHISSAQEFSDEGFSIEVLIKYFGSYNNALKVLNLKTNKQPVIVTGTKKNYYRNTKILAI